MHCCHPSCESFFHQKPVLAVLFNPFRRLQGGLQGLCSKAALCMLSVHCCAVPGSKSCFHMQPPALIETNTDVPRSPGVITRSEALPHAVLLLRGTFPCVWVYWRWWWRSAAFPTQQCRELCPSLRGSRWWDDSWCRVFPLFVHFYPCLALSHPMKACVPVQGPLHFSRYCSCVSPLKHLQWLCYMRHWALFQVWV